MKKRRSPPTGDRRASEKSKANSQRLGFLDNSLTSSSLQTDVPVDFDRGDYPILAQHWFNDLLPEQSPPAVENMERRIRLDCRLIFYFSRDWRLSADDRQWILERGGSVDKRNGRRRWRSESFVATTKAILLRCLRDKGAIVDRIGWRNLNLLPATYLEWFQTAAESFVGRPRQGPLPGTGLVKLSALEMSDRKATFSRPRQDRSRSNDAIRA